MKKIYFLFLFVLCGCQSVSVPPSFVYREIPTDHYKLASWQKLTDPDALIRIYIEGDGYAFNHWGRPTSDPTPHGAFLRRIAFADTNPNVVYLARPCQYVWDAACSQKDWTTGRFSQKIVSSTAQAIRKTARDQKIVLIGYSGGAMLSGLVITQNPDLRVQKWITLAGVLNHTRWTAGLNLPPLKDSVDLDALPPIKQLHLIGNKDRTVSAKLTESLVYSADLIIIPNATHDTGFERYYPLIYENE